MRGIPVDCSVILDFPESIDSTGFSRWSRLSRNAAIAIGSAKAPLEETASDESKNKRVVFVRDDQFNIIN
jgi:hypothetical protein